MEAVAQQRDQHVQMAKLAHVLRVRVSMIRQRRGRQQRMDRRRLELESDRTVDRRGVQELIRIDRLRRARKAVDVFRHHGRGNDGGMQERASADDAVRIGHAATEQ